MSDEKNVGECPSCGGASTVTDSRPWNDGIKRRRRCIDCEHRWNTIETFWFDPSMRGQVDDGKIVSVFGQMDELLADAADSLLKLRSLSMSLRSVTFGITPRE